MLRNFPNPLNARILHLHIRVESMSNGMIDDAFLQTKISITLGSEEGYLVVYLGKFFIQIFCNSYTFIFWRKWNELQVQSTNSQSRLSCSHR